MATKMVQLFGISGQLKIKSILISNCSEIPDSSTVKHYLTVHWFRASKTFVYSDQSDAIYGDHSKSPSRQIAAHPNQPLLFWE